MSVLNPIIDVFNTVLFKVEIAGLPISTTVLEVLAFVTGVICVWYAAKNHILNFPFGIINTSLFVVLFLGVGLYADMALQFVYIALNAAGWYWWVRGGKGNSALEIRRTSTMTAVCMVAALGAGTWLIYSLLTSHTDSSVPLWDALTTSLSLVAQYMLSRRLVENWLVWIAADLIYIPLYAYKGLYLTSALYCVFLTLCVFGIVEWSRKLSAHNERRIEAA